MPGGRPKAFSGPRDLWNEFQLYIEDIKANPIELQKWVGKEGKEVKSKHYKPPNWSGFESFLHLKGRIYDLDDYRRNVGRGYDEYQGILRAIGAYMYDRKYAGAAVGEYQWGIIAREIGLRDSQEIVASFERPILDGGKELPGDDTIPQDPLLE